MIIIPPNFIAYIQCNTMGGDKVRRTSEQTVYKLCESLLVVMSLLSIMIYVVCVCFCGYVEVYYSYSLASNN